MARVRVLPHVELLAEQVRVLDLNQGLNVPVAQINQIDRVLVARHNVRQLVEGLREERFQVSCVRVVPRVLDFLWSRLWRAVDDEDARLVPDAAEELAAGQQGHLRDILAGEDLVVSQGELFVLERAKEHAVTTAEAVLVWSVCLDDLVDVSCEQFDLLYLH